MVKGKISIKDRGVIFPVDTKNIIAIEVDVYQCTFYLENDEKLHPVQSLTETLSLLPADSFVQIRRDTIINLNKIKKYRDNKVFLTSGLEYPIPYRKRKMVKDLLLKL
jgi:DNA-binding LytR/AlgR family response regulator